MPIVSNLNTKEEYNLRLKNLLEKLKEVLKNKGESIIIGHDNIDVDAVLSGILLEKLFQYLSINAHFKILQPVAELKESETYKIISELTNLKIEQYVESTEDSSRTLFLVDHYETIHSGAVVGCIDHHPTEKENTYEFSYVRDCTAAAFMVYELMKAAEYPLTKEDAQLVIIAMMVDTISFKSTKAIESEVVVAKELAEKYNIDYSYLEKYCLCLTPIEKMEIGEIVANGIKTYNYGGHKVQSSYVQLYGLPDSKTVNEWIEYLHKKVSTEGAAELWVFLIIDTKSTCTYEYQIMKNYQKKIVHTEILSRGKDVMPKVEQKYYSSNSIEKKIEGIIEELSTERYDLATMESCTGGSLAGEITSVSGASSILRESYVTYCNEAKIKQGVPEKIIDCFTVYSIQTAKAMAYAVKKNANSSIGIGTTGQLGRVDPANPGVQNNKAWYCIRISENCATSVREVTGEIIFTEMSRKDQKGSIIEKVIDDLYAICMDM
jgi:PncC family amidohydrolase